MHRRSLNTVLFLTALFLTGIGFCLPAGAQSPEEMQELRLYFKEEELVQAATRHPKPLSQTAENITVIKAADIEAMNAHTVAEVLNRVSGVFVDFNRDFGAASLLSIQGSEPRHVLILLDGMPWNFLSEGGAETRAIPVGIIDRIEIVKGPASSAWGSSLGGVINILTKSAGKKARPTGAVQAASATGRTRDYSAQAAGLAGPVGYYLFAGRQESDGLRNDRKFTNSSLFSKFSLPLGEDWEVGLTAGFSKPANDLGAVPSGDTTTFSDDRSFFMSASLDAALTPDLDLNLSLYKLEQNVSLRTNTLGLGIFSPTQDFFSENIFDERTTGARGKVVWVKGMHTAVIGVDFDRGELEQTLNAGPFLQTIGVPAQSRVEPGLNRWAVYANDTIAFDRWSVTPGIRYDENSIVGSFVSPSLGLTYKVGEKSLARGSIARGFTQPPLSLTSAGGLFLNPNPALKQEGIWSYQAGLESTAARYLWLKGTVFYHDLDNELVRERGAAGPPTFNDLGVNSGGIRRRGIELEGETVPFYDTSFVAGFAYVHIRSDNATEARGRYSYNLGLKYDDRKTLQAQLFGRYTWWDVPGGRQADYGDFIWDLNVAWKFLETRYLSSKLFFTAHNLLNGDQYTFIDSRNPDRWLEAGIKITF